MHCVDIHTSINKDVCLMFQFTVTQFIDQLPNGIYSLNKIRLFLIDNSTNCCKKNAVVYVTNVAIKLYLELKKNTVITSFGMNIFRISNT